MVDYAMRDPRLLSHARNDPEAMADRAAAPGWSPPRPADAVDLLRILLRRRTLIALTILAITGLTVLVAYNVTPLYTATAVVMIDTPAVSEEDTTLNAKADAQLEQRIATETQLLQSRGLAKQVVEELELADDDEFAPSEQRGLVAGLIARVLPESWSDDLLPPSPPDAETSTADAMERLTDRLMDRIEVEQEGQSNLLNVRVTSVDPEKAAMIANAIVKNHIDGRVKKKRKAARRNHDWLTQRVAELRRQLLDADRAVAAYKRQKRLLAGNSEEPRLQMQRLDAQLAEARAGRVEAEARFRGLQALTGDARGLEAGAKVVTSPLLDDLRSQDAAIRRRIAELSAFYGPGHPELRNANAQLEEVRGRIGEEVRRISEDLRNDISVGRAREGQLMRDIGTLREQAFSQGTASVGLMDLEREAETTRMLYVSLLSQLKQVDDGENRVSAGASLLTEALVPDTPSSPAPKRMIGVALVASLLFAFLFAFIAETLDRRLLTTDHIERLLRVPTLAMVPELPHRWSRLPIHAYQVQRPRSVFSETMRNIQMELALRRRGSGAQVILLTSALPGEGKTTLSLSLAAAAASVGRSAVVVDVDLRRPGLQQALKRSCEGPDLIDYLTGACDLEAILVADDRVEKLWTISVRQPANDPRALLSSPRMKELLDELRNRFELVTLSAPPILPVMDAKILAGMADATLLVVHWGKTKQDAARAAMQILDTMVTAAVLNRVSYNKHAKLAFGDAIHHYSQYSTYYAEDSRPVSS